MSSKGNPDAIDDDTYEEIYNLLGKGEKRILRQKYYEKNIWWLTSNPRLQLEKVKTELNLDRAEIIVSIIYFIIVLEYVFLRPGISGALDIILKYKWF